MDILFEKEWGELISKRKLKGGKKEMETKSRYEVIAELEDKKRNLIREREGFDKRLLEKKKELRDLKREIEDKDEEIKEFESSMVASKETINTLIKSVDDSLDRFTKLGGKK